MVVPTLGSFTEKLRNYNRIEMICDNPKAMRLIIDICSGSSHQRYLELNTFGILGLMVRLD
jgi:hypothetical protein